MPGPEAFHGQKTVQSFTDAGVTATPAAFASKKGEIWTFQALPTNTQNVLIGDSAGQFLVLEPGDKEIVFIEDTALVWRKSASGTQVINVFGTR